MGFEPTFICDRCSLEKRAIYNHCSNDKWDEPEGWKFVNFKWLCYDCNTAYKKLFDEFLNQNVSDKNNEKELDKDSE